MEAHKERTEQLRKEENDRNKERNKNGGRAEDTGSLTSVDPVAKVLIRETIISDGKTAGRGSGGVEDPEDVLVYSRSVNKIDSSLE